MLIIYDERQVEFVNGFSASSGIQDTEENKQKTASTHKLFHQRISNESHSKERFFLMGAVAEHFGLRRILFALEPFIHVKNWVLSLHLSDFLS